MEQTELQRAIEAILFAAGEPVEISRLAFALECDEADVADAADTLAGQLAFERRGIRLLKLENAYQMVSSGEMADFVTKALETRKPPKLSSSQLETLTIIAYYQPATKAMVEQIRGVDSAYSVSALLNKKLAKEEDFDEKAYGAFSAQGDACVGCGQCEDACPQKLQIRKLLEEAHKNLS
jgi:segregation and condensation protein B